MSLAEFGVVAARHLRSGLAEELYLLTGNDLTRPVTIYGTVNEVCNYKCRYCECWRMPEYKPEMSLDEWKRAIVDLKKFLGRFHLQFSGGEPYIRKGFLDLIDFCHSEQVSWGVVTNGSAFVSDKVVRATIAAAPFTINISIDSKRAEIHDYSRGIEGSLERVVNGIGKLAAARKQAGLSFPIVIKPVVHRLNFRFLPEMVSWIQEIGATVIHFQPVDRWTPETYDELWISKPEDLEALGKVRNELLEMKRAGAPILNTEITLLAWEKHFREEKADPEYMPCRVGLRNYFIRPDGDVELCWFYPPVGNVKRNTAREIWYGEAARQRRRETVECESLCLFTCLSHKTLGDKLKMGLTLIAGVSKNHWKPAAGGTPPGD